MKKVLAIILCLALLTAVFIMPTSALTEEEANAGYYLVGTMTDWNIDSAYRLSQNPADPSEYCWSSLPLTTADEFKVVYTHDGRTFDEWFPAGYDNSCTLAAQDIFTDGIVALYFRPNMDGDDSWYFGCIYLELKSVKPTESIDPTVPTENNGGYYLVFSKYQNALNERFKMVPYFGGHYALHDVDLCTSDRIKVAYSSDGKTIDQLYPEGEENYYAPQYNSVFYTVEFAPLGDGGADGDIECFEGYIKAWPCEPPQEDETEPVPAEQTDFSFNRYEDRFNAAYPNVFEDVEYQEIYAHDARWEPDWVLVRTTSIEPIDGDCYGVFDDAVVYSAEDYPFSFGFGVYDVAADRFYSITQAWNMDFTDLHDVFINITQSFEITDPLGDADADGEITIIDVTVIQRALAGMRDLDDCSWWFEHYSCSFGTCLTSLADYDDDGAVTILDATFIQRHLVGNSLYSHSFTVSALPEKKTDGWYINARTSFGDEPVTYRYSIQGGFHAYSTYGDDWGDFTYNDPDYEPVPGNFYVTTGDTDKSSVRLPLNSLTYHDQYTLVVTAKDACGKTDTIYLPFTDRYIP